MVTGDAMTTMLVAEWRGVCCQTETAALLADRQRVAGWATLSALLRVAGLVCPGMDGVPDPPGPPGASGVIRWPHGGVWGMLQSWEPWTHTLHELPKDAWSSFARAVPPWSR